MSPLVLRTRFNFMIEWKRVKIKNYKKFHDAAVDDFHKDPLKLPTCGKLIIWDDEFEEYSNERLIFSMFSNSW